MAVLARLKNAIGAYRMRWKRRRRLFAAFRSRRDLELVIDRTDKISASDVLLFSTIRNELDRLPHFLSHYRSLGIAQFVIVDNGSNDGTREFLEKQDDVSLWATDESYRNSHFGSDWLTWLKIKYGHGHWCLSVDADEIFIYPEWVSNDLQKLTAALDQTGAEAMGALMLDMYPKGRLDRANYVPGEDPFKALCWFDSGPFSTRRQYPMENLWVQGGVRQRVLFSDEPVRAPTLNKLPLVKWDRRYAYFNSTHSMLPQRLNRAYDGPGDTRLSGVLLHTKFLPTIGGKSAEEKSRREHFGSPGDFDQYYDRLISGESLWCEKSKEYSGWQQLVTLGIMSAED